MRFREDRTWRPSSHIGQQFVDEAVQINNDNFVQPLVNDVQVQSVVGEVPTTGIPYNCYQCINLAKEHHKHHANNPQNIQECHTCFHTQSP